MKKGVLVPVILILVFLIGGTVFAHFMNVSEEGHLGVVPNPQSNKSEMISLYFTNRESDKIILEKRHAKVGEEIEKRIVEELIKGPDSEELFPTFPKGTEVYGVEVIEGVAFVNFKESILNLHWGGTSGEMVTLSSLVLSLTVLDHVDSVQILIEGERVETLAGHYSIMQPLKREEMLNYLQSND
ncbi:GerMN domain-containing protein [Proteinivorax hydrogeniformans]|uniref:GerMN domain-containing protein n=1 Tax=Proteinivorax hydrogeniformans TaxID=1826727 RepID=A0AAU8HWB3_9FIRM